jgi:hypothetical protein
MNPSRPSAYSTAPPAPARVPVIKRPTRLLERQWPWVMLALLVSGGLAALALLVFTGLLDHADPAYGGRNLRGYTFTGLGLGGFALALVLLTFLYTMRKRSMQERMPLGKSTMMTWLWLHVYLGFLALMVAGAHAGFGLVSGGLSTGKLLFFVLALLVLSGAAWRLAYRVVPPVAAPQIGNYAQAAMLKRAEEQLIEVEKIAAGKSQELHALKTWLLAADQSPAEVQQAAARLPPQEREDLLELHKHTSSRHRALLRAKLQVHYVRLLQAWRVLHVPLTLVFLGLIVAHVIGALDLPSRQLPLSHVARTSFAGYAPAEDCGVCHKTLYTEWTGSMHAHALSSPVMIAQTNQDAKVTLAGKPAPDPAQVCVNCHAPVATMLLRQTTLPIDDDARMHEGVGCSTCHQWDGEAHAGIAGMSVWQGGLERGHIYLGPFQNPVGNAYHQSDDRDIYKRADQLCLNCHDVNYDLNGDGKIVKGEDLVLQQTHDEWSDYRAAGGKGTCVGCHMPVVQGLTRAADGARIPFDQDIPGPPRVVHEHSFVGVDYPLDTVTQSDPHKDARAALLRGAVKLVIDPAPVAVSEGQLALRIEITNVGSGHNIPTGFAFARQMWLEVKVADRTGATFFTSGALASNVDDLCDQTTLDEQGHPPRKLVQGCDKTDPELVSFQTRLVDHIEVLRDKQGAKVKDARGDFVLAATEASKETSLQYLTGGPVARTRPSDGQKLVPIAPGETRSFVYKVPLPGRFLGAAIVSARLLFRNLPPYMLRDLDAHQAPGEVRLGTLIKNLQIVEMATQKVTLELRGR